MTSASILAKALRAITYVVAHGLVAGAIIAVTLIMEWGIEHAGDPKVFDLCPWRYIFDAVDLSIVGVFLWFGTREAVSVFREDADEPEEEAPIHA